jgi:hypothetical protein
MMDRRPLFLYEHVMLLALERKKGTPHFGLQYQFAISAALLAELLLERRITLEGDDGKQLVTVEDRRPLGDPLLDECLERVATAKRPVTPKTWITKFAGIRGLKTRVADGLVKLAILRAVDTKVLLVFPRTVYPERDAGPRREVVKRLKQAIFSYSAEVDSRIVVLVAIAHATGVLAHVFDKKRLKERKRRLERLTAESREGQATKELTDAVRTAIAVAGTAAGIVATSGR